MMVIIIETTINIVSEHVDNNYFEMKPLRSDGPDWHWNILFPE